MAGLVGIACYLLWLAPAPRAVGRSGWRIELPNFRLTLLQIGIGVLDLIMVTLAMYVLLPTRPPSELPNIMVVFLTATLLGTVSHAPAGLGVIEATMLLGLPQFPREALLAALLTFRALYFLLAAVPRQRFARDPRIANARTRREIAVSNEPHKLVRRVPPSYSAAA